MPMSTLLMQPNTICMRELASRPRMALSAVLCALGCPFMTFMPCTGLCRSINPHIVPTLDAFRRTPQPAGSGRATGRSADVGAQPPPLSTFTPRQPGSTPLGGHGDRSVSGISSFAFQVQPRVEAVSFAGPFWGGHAQYGLITSKDKSQQLIRLSMQSGGLAARAECLQQLLCPPVVTIFAISAHILAIATL